MTISWEDLQYCVLSPVYVYIITELRLVGRTKVVLFLIQKAFSCKGFGVLILSCSKAEFFDDTYSRVSPPLYGISVTLPSHAVIACLVVVLSQRELVITAKPGLYLKYVCPTSVYLPCVCATFASKWIINKNSDTILCALHIVARFPWLWLLGSLSLGFSRYSSPWEWDTISNPILNDHKQSRSLICKAKHVAYGNFTTSLTR